MSSQPCDTSCLDDVIVGALKTLQNKIHRIVSLAPMIYLFLHFFKIFHSIFDIYIKIQLYLDCTLHDSFEGRASNFFFHTQRLKSKASD